MSRLVNVSSGRFAVEAVRVSPLPYATASCELIVAGEVQPHKAADLVALRPDWQGCRVEFVGGWGLRIAAADALLEFAAQQGVAA